jgi:sarcosine oxidase subunit alpha
VAAALGARAQAQAGLDLVAGAEVVGWYDEGTVAAVRGADLLLCRPGAVVLASGAHELVPPFVSGDLPGVMTGGAALRLLAAHGLTAGRAALVLTDGERGYAVARQLAAAGMSVVCVADLRPGGRDAEARGPDAEPRGPDAEPRASETDTPVSAGIAGVRSLKAHGFNAVRAVSLEVRPHGAAAPRTVKLRCDLVCVCLGARPADELARQALGAGRYALSGADAPARGGQRSSARASDGVAGPGGATLFVAGGAAAVWSAAAAIAGGEAAGRAAAQASAVSDDA